MFDRLHAAVIILDLSAGDFQGPEDAAAFFGDVAVLLNTIWNSCTLRPPAVGVQSLHHGSPLQDDEGCVGPELAVLAALPTCARYLYSSVSADVRTSSYSAALACVKERLAELGRIGTDTDALPRTNANSRSPLSRALCQSFAFLSRVKSTASAATRSPVIVLRPPTTAASSPVVPPPASSGGGRKRTRQAGGDGSVGVALEEEEQFGLIESSIISTAVETAVTISCFGGCSRIQDLTARIASATGGVVSADVLNFAALRVCLSSSLQVRPTAGGATDASSLLSMGVTVQSPFPTSFRHDTAGHTSPSSAHEDEEYTDGQDLLLRMCPRCIRRQRHPSSFVCTLCAQEGL